MSGAIVILSDGDVDAIERCRSIATFFNNTPLVASLQGILDRAALADPFNALVSRIDSLTLLTAVTGEIEMSNLDDIKAALDAAAAQAAQTEDTEKAALGVLNTLQGQVASLTQALANAGIPPELVAQAQAISSGLADATAPLAAAIAALPTPATPTEPTA